MSLSSSVVTRRILPIYHATNLRPFLIISIYSTTNAMKTIRVSTSNRRDMAIYQRTTRYSQQIHYSDTMFQFPTQSKHLGRSGVSPLSEGVLLRTRCCVHYFLSFPFYYLFLSFCHLILSFPFHSDPIECLCVY